MSSDLETRLRRSAPTVNVSQCASVVSDLVAEVTTARRRPRLARGKRRTAAMSLAAAVFVPTAAFAAVHFAAETGQFGKPGATENDTSQYVNMCASDVSSYMATLEPRDLALPAGVTWTQIGQRNLAAWQATCPPRDTGSIVQVSGIKGGYVHGAECAWEKDFLGASGAAAAQERQRASEAIVSAEDALVALGVDGDGGAKSRRDRAAQGDAAWISYDYQVNCLGRDTAANPPTVAQPR